MKNNRRIFSRPSGQLRYNKRFIIATEGSKTEKQYFEGLTGMCRGVVVSIKCLPSRGASSPEYVLQRMKSYISKERLMDGDEAWLVVDKDEWEESKLDRLAQWADEKEQYGLALSNPKFEYWLLLHFEAGNGITSSTQCSQRLKQHLPEYDKNIDMRKISKEMVCLAMVRGGLRDAPVCIGWPRNMGVTTVYRLVKKILSE